MSWRINQVELVDLTVGRGVGHRHRVTLNGDTFFSLEIHRVEHLRLHLAHLNCFGMLEQTVGKRRLPVVDVSNDTKVANVAKWHGKSAPNGRADGRKVKGKGRPRPWASSEREAGSGKQEMDDRLQ